MSGSRGAVGGAALGPGGGWELGLPTGIVSDPTALLYFQKCEHCQRLGATIPCRAAGCPRLYHFPCAAASGCFQSMKTLRLLCPQHLAEALQMGAYGLWDWVLGPLLCWRRVPEGQNPARGWL